MTKTRKQIACAASLGLKDRGQPNWKPAPGTFARGAINNDCAGLQTFMFQQMRGVDLRVLTTAATTLTVQRILPWAGMKIPQTALVVVEVEGEVAALEDLDRAPFMALSTAGWAHDGLVLSIDEILHAPWYGKASHVVQIACLDGLGDYADERITGAIARAGATIVESRSTLAEQKHGPWRDAPGQATRKDFCAAVAPDRSVDPHANLDTHLLRFSIADALKSLRWAWGKIFVVDAHDEDPAGEVSIMDHPCP